MLTDIVSGPAPPASSAARAAGNRETSMAPVTSREIHF